MKKTKIIVFMGLFIALHVVFTRILRPIELPYLRVSFGFLATSMVSMFLGPVLGGINAAISDVVGYFLFPSGNPFFPGFTLSAFITGLVYGVFLYKKEKTIVRITLAVLVVSVVVDLGLNTYWLSILLDQAWRTFFVARLIRTGIMFPIQVFFIYTTWKYVGNQVERLDLQKSSFGEEKVATKDYLQVLSYAIIVVLLIAAFTTNFHLNREIDERKKQVKELSEKTLQLEDKISELENEIDNLKSITD